MKNERYKKYYPRKDLHKCMRRRYRNFYVENYKPLFVKLHLIKTEIIFNPDISNYERKIKIEDSTECLFDFNTIISAVRKDNYNVLTIFDPVYYRAMYYGCENIIERKQYERPILEIKVKETFDEILNQINE